MELLPKFVIQMLPLASIATPNGISIPASASQPPGVESVWPGEDAPEPAI
jgi:hypothetical protein